MDPQAESRKLQESVGEFAKTYQKAPHAPTPSLIVLSCLSGRNILSQLRNVYTVRGPFRPGRDTTLDLDASLPRRSHSD